MGGGEGGRAFFKFYQISQGSEQIMPKYKYCQKCGDPDVSFEKKFCSLDCADLYDGIDDELWQQLIKEK